MRDVPAHSRHLFADLPTCRRTAMEQGDPFDVFFHDGLTLEAIQALDDAEETAYSGAQGPVPVW